MASQDMLSFKYRVFLSAARLLSFSKAAKELSLTQPAVSFQVKHLEEELEARLFLRYPNRVELTAMGELLLKEISCLDTYSEKAQEKIMAKLGKLWGTVVVGASTTVGNYFLPQVLAEFNQRYDEVSLKINVGNTDDIVGLLADGIIDFAIVEGEIKGRQWEVEEAFEVEMVVIAPPDFPCMGKGIITQKQLSAQPFISREKGSGTRAFIDSLKDGNKPLIPQSSIVLELGSNSAIKTVVEEGLGISMVSLMTLEKEIRLGTISILRVIDHQLFRKAYFVFNKGGSKNKLVQEMISLCKEKAKELKATERDMK